MTAATDAGTAAVVEALLSLNETAKRCPCVVHRFAEDAPTMWDRRHLDIDALLDRLVGPSE
jgi:hypothetical protein